MDTKEACRVVIIGAGFAGLWAARNLSKKENIDITVIDRNNYHTFLPLLYQVAAAELDPGQIAYPIRGIFRNKKNIHSVLAEVTSVDIEKKIVHTDNLDYEYDHLIVSPGSLTAYFGVKGAEEYSYSLKSLEDSVLLRNRLLSIFELASQTKPEERPDGMLRIVVVGSGPTGVEYAGALAELINSPLAKDFPELNKIEPQVVLLDGADKPLVGFKDKLRDYTAERLSKKGVKLHFGSPVAEVSPEGVVLKDGTHIASNTVVWTAGIKGNDVASKMKLSLGRGDRIQVTPSLQIKEHPEIHVAGDVSLIDGQNIPTVAPNAIQQGTHVAKNILRILNNEQTEQFSYHDKGAMVTIGRNAAVAQFGKFKFTGFFAWILWLTVHLTYLMGFRSRISVFLSWSWDYLFFERAVRLILPKNSNNFCKNIEKKHEDISNN